MKKDYKIVVKKVDSTSMDMCEESMDIAIAKVSNLINKYIEDKNKLSLIFCDETVFIYEATEIRSSNNRN